MPTDLVQTIAEQAARETRSVSQQIVHLLKAALTAKDKSHGR